MDYNIDEIVQQLASIYSDVMEDGIEDVRFYLQKTCMEILSDDLKCRQNGTIAKSSCDIVNDNYDNIIFFAEEIRSCK